jgi:hypothetical protein
MDGIVGMTDDGVKGDVAKFICNLMGFGSNVGYLINCKVRYCQVDMAFKANN